MPFSSAHITQIHSSMDTSADDSAVRKLRPIARADNSRIARAHVELAVGIAAERILFFESEHDVLEAVKREVAVIMLATRDCTYIQYRSGLANSSSETILIEIEGLCGMNPE